MRCKKGGRVLAELRRAREQLRMIQADRQRQQEYRASALQQYAFLEDFLRQLSDDVGSRNQCGERVYDPVVMVYGNRVVSKNGDQCMDFSGVQNKYYIILCDGMGTGPGAVQEGRSAGILLRRMLSSGFPAEHALESLNSICVLRDRAAAVTVDLTEISLDTGKVTVYKWGSPASFLVGGGSVEKLGVCTAPPGFVAADGCQSRCSVTMGKGQTLLMVSDGIAEERVLEVCREQVSPASLAQSLLKDAEGEDDATVVTVRLIASKT